MNSKHLNTFEALLAEEGWLCNLSRQLVRDPHAAADLAQETWLAALKAPPTGSGSPRGWLRTVAERIVQRKHFKSGARERRERDASQTERLPDTAEAVAHAENLRALAQATLGLEEPFRETVLLRYFEDMSSGQIARKMGVPTGTVRSRLTRAHGKLRAELTGSVEETDLRGAGWLATLRDWCIDQSNRLALSRGALGWGAALGVVALTVLVHSQLDAGARDALVPAAPSASSGALASSNAPQAGTGAGHSGPESARTSVTNDAGVLAASVTGSILAPDGSPVVDARLIIRASASGGARLGVQGEAPSEPSLPARLELRSDARGAFSVPHRYMSAVSSRWESASFRISHESDRFWRVSQALKLGDPIELRPLWKVALRGEVRDAETGQALSGVQVFYGPDGVETVTDAQGEFRLDGLPSYQGRTTRLFHPDYLLQASSTPLVGAEPAVQVFRLERGRALEVSFEDSQSGRALSGVEVFLDEEGEASVHSDAAGRVRVRVPASGPQVLRGECAGYANFEWRFVSAAVEEASLQRVPLARLSHVDGVIQDTDGRGLERVLVRSSSLEDLAPAQLPGLAGTLLWTLGGVRGWEPALNTNSSDPSGRFHVAVLESQGPWKIFASVHKVGRAEEIVDSIEEAPTLVLKPTRMATGIILSGTLVRGDKPWNEDAHLILVGPATVWASAGKGGAFDLRVYETGAYQLTWAGQPLLDVSVNGGASKIDLGVLDLGRLPLLDLRLEDASGAALTSKRVWIRALDPPPLTPVGSQGFPDSTLVGKTDGQGRLRVLLPRDGEYSIALSDEEVVFRQNLRVQGDSDEVIRVPEAERVFLRLRHAESRELLGELAYEQWMVSLSSGPADEVRMARGQTRFDGLFEILVPRGTPAIFLRPISAGFQTQELDRAQFAGTSVAQPRDVFLQPGYSVLLEFDEWPRDELGDGMDLFLVAKDELGLVREVLPREQLAALAARGSSVRFVDPLLAATQLMRANGSLSLSGGGVTPGVYTIVAFDRTRRRSDVTFDPPEFDVGPEITSVQLRLVK